MANKETRALSIRQVVTGGRNGDKLFSFPMDCMRASTKDAAKSAVETAKHLDKGRGITHIEALDRHAHRLGGVEKPTSKSPQD